MSGSNVPSPALSPREADAPPLGGTHSVPVHDEPGRGPVAFVQRWWRSVFNDNTFARPVAEPATQGSRGHHYFAHLMRDGDSRSGRGGPRP